MVEKVLKPITKDYAGVALYIDDIKEIVSILDDLNKKDKTRIQTADHSFSDVDEFIQHYKGRRIGFLAFSNSSINTPYISLNIKASTISPSALYVSENTLEGKGVFSQLDDVLTRSSPRFKFLYNENILPMLDGIFIYGFFKELLSFSSSLSGAAYTRYLVWLAFWGLGLLISFSLSLGRRSFAIIKSKAESPSFFQRHRDEFIKDILKVTIGAVIALVLSNTFGKKCSDVTGTTSIAPKEIQKSNTHHSN